MQRRIVELSNFKSKIQWRPAPAGGILGQEPNVWSQNPEAGT
jgi:hypothetical protein